MSLPKPLGNRVLVDIARVQRVTEGGIIQPVTAVGDVICGEILAIGSGVSAEIRPGNIVHFHKGAMMPVAGPRGALGIVMGDAVLCTEDKKDLHLMSPEEAEKFTTRRIEPVSKAPDKEN